jgi:hypothetical protein
MKIKKKKRPEARLARSCPFVLDLGTNRLLHASHASSFDLADAFDWQTANQPTVFWRSNVDQLPTSNQASE